MSDPREELAAVVRDLRRTIERAAGGADLLADAAVRARRTRVADAPAAVAPAPMPSIAQAHDARLAERAEVEEALARASAPPPPAPVAGSLFGEPDPAPAPARPAKAPAPLPPFHAPLQPLDPEQRRAIAEQARAPLAVIDAEVKACRNCGLAELRTNAVPGVGTAISGIMFVGEGPGADEDRLGEPFVGRAGQLLDRIIEAMNKERLLPELVLDRTTVYIANIVKCRPPENRVPLPHEVEACTPYLKRQIAALKPRIICCLGKTAAEHLLGAKGSLASMRGRVYRYEGAKLIVTYHPAACLRNPEYKRPVWEDMQLLAREYRTD